MGPFEMVVAIVLIATFGKIAQSFASRPRPSEELPTRGRVEALEAHLQANDARVAQAEERVAELSEKLEFMEKLLAGPDVGPRIEGRRPRED